MFKVILEAKDIPIGSNVRTEEGCFQTYVLINEIHVIADSQTFENRAHPDCLFIMVPHNIGSLKVITPTTKLEWVIRLDEDFEQFKDFLKTEQP